jgi:hypothetical protein
MSSVDFERRRPRVTIQDLRRELRHADEQLFRLLAPARPAPGRLRSSRGPIALALIGMVPLAFGAWASFAAERPTQTAAVHVEVTPIAAMIVPPPAPPEPLSAEYQPARPERPVTPEPPVPPAPRPAVTRRVAAPPKSAEASVAPRQAAWEPPRRHVPRPLSPGEFGRR